jgi:hypothetical protein
VTISDDVARWLRSRHAIRQYWPRRHGPLVRRWLREWLVECRLSEDVLRSYSVPAREDALDEARETAGPSRDLDVLRGRILD